MNKPPYIVIDCETTGLDPHKDKLHGLGVAFAEDDTVYLSFEELHAGRSELADYVHECLQDRAIPKVGWNIRFDARFLECNGMFVNGDLIDVMCMAQLLNENESVGLKYRVEKELGHSYLEEFKEMDRAMEAAGVKNIGALCAVDLTNGKYFDTISKYCMEDCNNTLKLFHVFSEKLKKLKTDQVDLIKYFKEEVVPLEQVLLSMELRGIRIDLDLVAKAEKELSQEMQGILGNLSKVAASGIAYVEEELYKKALEQRKSDKGKANVLRRSEKYGTLFNWSSSGQLGDLIYKHYKATPVFKTKTGKFCTGEKELVQLEKNDKLHPDLKAILKGLSEYRRVEKLLGTYVVGMRERAVDGRIYASYLQAGSDKQGGKGGTVTGRLSSQNPNMQNLPRKAGIKDFFKPDPGHVFLYADYSQIELRVAAHLSREQALIDAFNNGIDMHQQTADLVGAKNRQIGKTLNFAMIFDAREFRLLEEASKADPSLTIDDMKEMRKEFFNAYPAIRDYLANVKAFVREKGYIYSPFGRVRRLPEIHFGKYIEWDRDERGRSVPVLKQSLPESMRALLTKKGEPLAVQANKKYKHAQKQAYNFPIQSPAASLAKRAMVRLYNSGFQVVSQVHDAIITQVREEEAEFQAKRMQKIMEQQLPEFPLSVPLVAEVKVLRSLSEEDLAPTTPLKKQLA